MWCFIALGGAMSLVAVTYVRVKVATKKKLQAWKDFTEAVKPWLHTDDN
jgi:hypothetical protein